MGCRGLVRKTSLPWGFAQGRFFAAGKGVPSTVGEFESGRPTMSSPHQWVTDSTFAPFSDRRPASLTRWWVRAPGPPAALLLRPGLLSSEAGLCVAARWFVPRNRPAKGFCEGVDLRCRQGAGPGRRGDFLRGWPVAASARQRVTRPGFDPLSAPSVLGSARQWALGPSRRIRDDTAAGSAGLRGAPGAIEERVPRCLHKEPNMKQLKHARAERRRSGERDRSGPPRRGETRRAGLCDYMYAPPLTASTWPVT